MTKVEPSVAVVLLNWNGLSDTRECLESLRHIAYPNFRTIVVDNGSREDEASALEAEFGDAIEVRRMAENLGFAGGANAGIQRALEGDAEYVLLLNNDTIVEPDFLGTLVKAAENIPKVAALCPKTYFYGQPRTIYSTGGSVSVWRGVAKQIGRGEKDTGQYDEVARRDYADGVCMLIPRAAIEKVGLLDEQYFAYWEETDWCVRARDKGLHCYYVPQSKVWHKANRSRRPDARFHYLYRRNALLFVRKRGTGLQMATALVSQVFFYAPMYFITHPKRISRAFAEFRGLFWHVRNQPKERPLL